jgi:hypothetical protein
LHRLAPLVGFGRHSADPGRPIFSQYLLTPVEVTIT